MRSRAVARTPHSTTRRHLKDSRDESYRPDRSKSTEAQVLKPTATAPFENGVAHAFRKRAATIMPAMMTIADGMPLMRQ